MTIFDEVVEATVDGTPSLTVVHRDTEGKPYAWHSPMREDDIDCSICKSGVRVYLVSDEREV